MSGMVHMIFSRKIKLYLIFLKMYVKNVQFCAIYFPRFLYTIFKSITNDHCFFSMTNQRYCK